MLRSENSTCCVVVHLFPSLIKTQSRLIPTFIHFVPLKTTFLWPKNFFQPNIFKEKTGSACCSYYRKRINTFSKGKNRYMHVYFQLLFEFICALFTLGRHYCIILIHKGIILFCMLSMFQQHLLLAAIKI